MTQFEQGKERQLLPSEASSQPGFHTAKLRLLCRSRRIGGRHFGLAHSRAMLFAPGSPPLAQDARAESARACRPGQPRRPPVADLRGPGAARARGHHPVRATHHGGGAVLRASPNPSRLVSWLLFGGPGSVLIATTCVSRVHSPPSRLTSNVRSSSPPQRLQSVQNGTECQPGVERDTYIPTISG